MTAPEEWHWALRFLFGGSGAALGAVLLYAVCWTCSFARAVSRHPSEARQRERALERKGRERTPAGDESTESIAIAKLTDTTIRIGTAHEESAAALLCGYYPNFLDGYSAGGVVGDIEERELGMLVGPTSSRLAPPMAAPEVSAEEEDEACRQLAELFLDLELLEMMERTGDEPMGNEAFDWAATFRWTSDGKRMIARLRALRRQQEPRTS